MKRARRRGVGLAPFVAATFCLITEAAAFSARDDAALDRLCRTEARGPPGETALAIAQGALAEHRRFGGHVIDRTGRLRVFGASEAETSMEERRDGEPARAPWRRVLAFWASLGPLEAAPLVVRLSREGGSDTDARAVGSLLDRLTALRPDDRDAARQAALRAAILDTPWSAAFVSFVVANAGAPRSRFEPAGAHRAYLGQAGQASLDAIAGRAVERLYRACDPRRTRARPGDLLCLDRSDGARADADSFSAFLRTVAAGENPVTLSHCDIVVARDPRKRTLTLVGGNVLHGVTLRDLHLSPSGVLPAPSAVFCPQGGPPGALCRPEMQPWFALLQAVEPSVLAPEKLE